MTIVRLFSSHTIRQKSPSVPGSGPNKPHPLTLINIITLFTLSTNILPMFHKTLKGVELVINKNTRHCMDRWKEGYVDNYIMDKTITIYMYMYMYLHMHMYMMYMWYVFLGCLREAFSFPANCFSLLSLQQNTLIFILYILAPAYAPLYFSKHWFAPLKIFPKKTCVVYMYMYM